MPRNTEEHHLGKTEELGMGCSDTLWPVGQEKKGREAISGGGNIMSKDL